MMIYISILYRIYLYGLALPVWNVLVHSIQGTNTCICVQAKRGCVTSLVHIDH